MVLWRIFVCFTMGSL